MRISLLDLAVLTHAVIDASKKEAVGFEDADRTLSQMRQTLHREVEMDKAVVESALWSCMLLMEEGQFLHPDGLSFEGFANKLAPQGERFNGSYCCFEEKV
jgi:hypothetical protein